MGTFLFGQDLLCCLQPWLATLHAINYYQILTRRRLNAPPPLATLALISQLSRSCVLNEISGNKPVVERARSLSSEVLEIV